jgi:hypothetical protein
MKNRRSFPDKMEAARWFQELAIQNLVLRKRLQIRVN